MTRGAQILSPVVHGTINLHTKQEKWFRRCLWSEVRRLKAGALYVIEVNCPNSFHLSSAGALVMTRLYTKSLFQVGEADGWYTRD